MANYIGALDQGTTSTRFILFDRHGQIAAVSQMEHRQIYPQPGWVEHDALEIWERTQQVIARAMAAPNSQPSDLAAIGITNQRETTVLWNRTTGKPIGNAIVWQDTRVAGYLAELSRSGVEDRVRAITGLPLATYFSALKIRWLLAHVPGAREQAEAGELAFGTIDTWLIWNLTGGPGRGVHVTDVTNASRTQLMSLQTLQWDPELLGTFDVPEAILSRIASSSEVYGTAELPSLAGVPIAGVLGDQQAALAGQTCFQPGQAKNTYGTGCFLLLNTGTKPVLSSHGLLTTLAYKFGKQPAHYALEGSVAVTGALVQWLRDNLGLIACSSEIEALARQVDDNGGIYFVPAFSGLFAPYWQPGARGIITGLTAYANKSHLARAVLEAAAFQTRELVEAMESDSGIHLDALRADGGMTDNDLLMQFQADLLARPVLRPAIQETTSLGAAYAAGLAMGFFSSTEDLCAQWFIEKTWTPAMPDERREELYRTWKKAVQRSMDWIEPAP